MSRSSSKIVNSINITPFVDVMLVLLIIFMAVTPMVNNSIDVDLPTANIIIPENDDANVNSVYVTLNKDNMVFLDSKSVGIKDIQFELLKKYTTDINLLLKGDKDVLYSDIINLMSELKKSGFDKISLVVEGGNQ